MFQSIFGGGRAFCRPGLGFGMFQRGALCLAGGAGAGHFWNVPGLPRGVGTAGAAACGLIPRSACPPPRRRGMW